MAGSVRPEDVSLPSVRGWLAVGPLGLVGPKNLT